MNPLAAQASGCAAGGALRVVWAVGGVLPQLSGRRRPGRTGPPVVGLGPVRLDTLPTLAGRPAKRSEPQAATSSRVQAVELRDTGRTPARHGAAGNPPDRWPGFGRPTHPTEDRERDLQRARDRRVRPGARFRTRARGSGLPVVPTRRPPPRMPPAARAKPPGSAHAGSPAHAGACPGTCARPAAHTVVPHRTGFVATPVTGVPPPKAARALQKPLPQTPTEPPTGKTFPNNGNCRIRPARLTGGTRGTYMNGAIGRVAQRKSTVFTRQGSLVRTQPRPPPFPVAEEAGHVRP